MARIGASGGGGATGTSGVTGVPPTDIDAIARWNDTTGTSIKNSPNTAVQDGGGIQAMGFIGAKEIIAAVVIPDKSYMIATGLTVMITGSISIGSDSELVLI